MTRRHSKLPPQTSVNRGRRASWWGRSMADFELSCGLPPGPYFADPAKLAEERTTRIGLGTAVLIPDERSVMTMASGIATIARISGGRFRACFGTGFTPRFALGPPPMTLTAPP